MRALILFLVSLSTAAVNPMPPWMNPGGALGAGGVSSGPCDNSGYTGTGPCMRQVGPTVVTRLYLSASAFLINNMSDDQQTTIEGGAATATRGGKVTVGGANSSRGGGIQLIMGDNGELRILDSASNVVMAVSSNTNRTLNVNYGINVTGTIVGSSSIQTGAPTTGTATPWKLGVIVTAACVLDATTYAQVEINGVFRKVALCQ